MRARVEYKAVEYLARDNKQAPPMVIGTILFQQGDEREFDLGDDMLWLTDEPPIHITRSNPRALKLARTALNNALMNGTEAMKPGPIQTLQEIVAELEASK